METHAHGGKQLCGTATVVPAALLAGVGTLLMPGAGLVLTRRHHGDVDTARHRLPDLGYRRIAITGDSRRRQTTEGIAKRQQRHHQRQQDEQRFVGGTAHVGADTTYSMDGSQAHANGAEVGCGRSRHPRYDSPGPGKFITPGSAGVTIGPVSPLFSRPPDMVIPGVKGIFHRRTGSHWSEIGGHGKRSPLAGAARPRHARQPCPNRYPDFVVSYAADRCPTANHGSTTDHNLAHRLPARLRRTGIGNHGCGGAWAGLFRSPVAGRRRRRTGAALCGSLRPQRPAPVGPAHDRA